MLPNLEFSWLDEVTSRPVARERNVDGKLSFKICSGPSETVRLFKCAALSLMIVVLASIINPSHQSSLEHSHQFKHQPTLLNQTTSHKQSHINMTTRYQDNFRHNSLTQDMHNLTSHLPSRPNSRQNSVVESDAAQTPQNSVSQQGQERKRSGIGKLFHGEIHPGKAYRSFQTFVVRTF